MNLVTWLRKLVARGAQAPTGFRSLETPEGRQVVVDDAFVRYLESTAPPPTQASLDRLLDSVGRVKVTAGGIALGRPLSEKVLVDTADDADLRLLRDALRIEDGAAGHCMCHGDLGLLFFDKAGRQLAAIGVHHGRQIRWLQWNDDAKLVAGWRLLDWLRGLGVSFPVKVDPVVERTLARIARVLGQPLQRFDRVSHATADGAIRLTLEVFGHSPNGTLLFAVRSDQYAALQGAFQSFAGLVCPSSNRLFLVPFTDLASWLAMRQPVMVGPNNWYWLLRIVPRDGRMVLQGTTPDQDLDVGQFLVPGN